MLFILFRTPSRPSSLQSAPVPNGERAAACAQAGPLWEVGLTPPAPASTPSQLLPVHHHKPGSATREDGARPHPPPAPSHRCLCGSRDPNPEPTHPHLPRKEQDHGYGRRRWREGKGKDPKMLFGGEPPETGVTGRFPAHRHPERGGPPPACALAQLLWSRPGSWAVYFSAINRKAVKGAPSANHSLANYSGILSPPPLPLPPPPQPPPAHMCPRAKGVFPLECCPLPRPLSPGLHVFSCLPQAGNSKPKSHS